MSLVNNQNVTMSLVASFGWVSDLLPADAKVSDVTTFLKTSEMSSCTLINTTINIMMIMLHTMHILVLVIIRVSWYVCHCMLPEPVENCEVKAHRVVATRVGILRLGLGPTASRCQGLRCHNLLEDLGDELLYTH